MTEEFLAKFCNKLASQFTLPYFQVLASSSIAIKKGEGSSCAK